MKYKICKFLLFFKIKCYYCDFFYKELENLSFYKRLESKLNEWRNLKEGWDGEDAIVPSSQVIDDVSDFIKYMNIEKMPSPTIYIAGDGEIGFRWNNGIRAHVSFLDDGNVVGYCQKYGLYKAIELDSTYSTLHKKLEVMQFLDKVKKIMDYQQQNKNIFS